MRKIKKYYIELGKEFETTRSKLGYGVRNIAIYLAEFWGITPQVCINWIVNLEDGSLLSRINDNQFFPGITRPEETKQRLSDYFSALGIEEKTKKRWLSNLKKLIPEFELPKTRVPYCEPNPENLTSKNLQDRIAAFCRGNPLIKTKLLKDLDEILNKYKA